MYIIYCCGPTVYDKVHLGNLRIYVFLDYFNKLITPNVTIVNITDIDDKILERTNKQNFDEFIRYYTKYFKKCLNYLLCTNILFESCVENISVIKNTIEQLENKQLVFFNFQKNALCFRDESTVWKNNSDIINWDSKWGLGRPGWHIECASLIRKNLDILNTKILNYHLGGVDLKPLHHKNEQLLLNALDYKIENWIHIAEVRNNGKKISKSLGNTITLENIISNPYVIRFFLLYRNYNLILNYSKEILECRKKQLYKMAKLICTYCFENNIKYFSDIKININSGTYIRYFLKKLYKIDSSFIDLIKSFNNFAKILPDHTFQIPDKVKVLIEQRNYYKNKNDFKTCDALRLEIEKLNYTLQDVGNKIYLIPFTKYQL